LKATLIKEDSSDSDQADFKKQSDSEDEFFDRTKIKK